jgi:hypothetical protein
LSVAAVCLAFCAPFGLTTTVARSAAANLTAAQIVERHVAARGGLAAWRNLQSLTLTGKMEVGSGDSAVRSNNFVRTETSSSHKKPAVPPPDQAASAVRKQVQLPFTLEVKRPRKSRLELEFAGKTAVQVYDGKNGWKLRPYLNRNDVEPFTADELKTEERWTGIDEPLIGYAGKVALESVEPVDGHDAYKLKLTLQDGSVQHIWIDAQSFLDVKVEGAPRRMDGRMHNVYVYQRDFRAVQGLMIPFQLETAVDGYRDTHRMLIEKAAVNAQVSDARFGKPGGA